MTDEELISYLRLQGLDKDVAAADRIEALVNERDGLLRVVTDNHVALLRAEAAEAKLAKLAINTRIFHINAEALSEIKAVVDGQSEQSIKAIIYGLLAELEKTE
jgi:hypothetical protein